MAHTWSVLSVSDLHYRSPDTNLTDDPKELGSLAALRDSVFANYKATLTACEPRSFDVVAVCGDITTRGRAEGFDDFERDSVPLLSALARRTKAVCLVPGNHDVEWGIDPRSPGSFDRKFRAFGTLTDRYDFTSCLLPMAEVGTGPTDH